MSAEIPDSVIVAVAVNDTASGKVYDFELPSRMTASDLTQGILRLLREFEPGQLDGRTIAELWAEGERIPENGTLASEGIWDGSEIILRFP